MLGCVPRRLVPELLVSFYLTLSRRPVGGFAFVPLSLDDATIGVVVDSGLERGLYVEVDAVRRRFRVLGCGEPRVARRPLEASLSRRVYDVRLAMLYRLRGVDEARLRFNADGRACINLGSMVAVLHPELPRVRTVPAGSVAGCVYVSRFTLERLVKSYVAAAGATEAVDAGEVTLLRVGGRVVRVELPPGLLRVVAGDVLRWRPLREVRHGG